MNIFVPFLTIVLVPLIFPLYFALNLLTRIKKHLYSENVAGKVVLITGASSGISEKLAYEYGKRGARLALEARSEDRIELEALAERVKKSGSPNLLVFCIDISNPQDCSRLVDQIVLHFDQLDHLVNNAGILRLSMFQDCNDVSNYAPIMDVNFWGPVHCTHSAIPDLRKTKDKIVVILSIGSWVPQPKLSFYNIGLNKRAAESSEACAKGIVESACHGDRYLTLPSFYKVTFLLKLLSPQLQE